MAMKLQREANQRMAKQQVNPDVTPERLIESMYKIVPAGSYVLFTPHEGMFVSPDPEDIKRSIDVLTKQLKG